MAPWSDWPHLSVAKGASTGRRVQYAALPYRVRRDGEVQIRLITSRETRRWVIPKGWPIKGLTPPKTAARECYEEAGLVGVVSREPLGSYTYEKRLGTRSVLCDVLVFPLKVKRLLQKWPERFQRYGFWFSIETAAAAVQEEDLSELILSFGAIMARRWEEAQAEAVSAAEASAAKEKPAKAKTPKARDGKAKGAKGKDAATEEAPAEPEVSKGKPPKEPKPAKADAKPAKAKATKAKAGKAKSEKGGAALAMDPDNPSLADEAQEKDSAPTARTKGAKGKATKVLAAKAKVALVPEPAADVAPAKAGARTKGAAKTTVAKVVGTATVVKSVKPKAVKPKVAKAKTAKAKGAPKPAKVASAKTVAGKTARVRKPAVKTSTAKAAKSPLASTAESATASKKAQARKAAAPKLPPKPKH